LLFNNKFISNIKEDENQIDDMDVDANYELETKHKKRKKIQIQKIQRKLL
jgi:hypothetical protein